jgi:hypothetical protein
MLYVLGGGRTYVGHLMDFCFPHPLEFDRHHLPRVGIFELSTILHPEEEHMLRTGTNDFQAFHHMYVCPTMGHLIIFIDICFPMTKKLHEKSNPRPTTH